MLPTLILLPGLLNDGDLWRDQLAGLADVAEVLARIGRLYETAADIRGRSADERRAERQARSKLIVHNLKPWFEQQLRRVSRGATIAKDIRYGLSHWELLARFLDDGRIELNA